MKKEITGYDFNEYKSDNQEVAVAYFRITPDMRDFIKLCDKKHGVVGFKYELDDLNFGIIINSPIPLITKS